MDTATMSSNEGNGPTVDDLCRYFGVDPVRLPAPTVRAYSILPMIDQRIHDEIEPQVKMAREDMEHAIVLKLEQLGINPNLTSTYSFARDVANKYREQLVGKRINGIVDDLISTKPVVMGMDMASGPDTSIITVTMPPNLTQPQRDAVIANLKAQLPADTQVVSVVGGAVLGRL